MDIMKLEALVEHQLVKVEKRLMVEHLQVELSLVEVLVEIYLDIVDILADFITKTIIIHLDKQDIMVDKDTSKQEVEVEDFMEVVAAFITTKEGLVDHLTLII